MSQVRVVAVASGEVVTMVVGVEGPREDRAAGADAAARGADGNEVLRATWILGELLQGLELLRNGWPESPCS